MSARSCASLLLLAVPLLAQGPPAGSPGGPPFSPPATATVNVDCAAGQTIGAALQTPAVALSIVFTGKCTEDVLIRRDDVTLRGGASGATIDGSVVTAAAAALTIDHSARVTLSDFAVRNSDDSGISIADSSVSAARLVVSDNAFVGIFVDGCTLRLADSSCLRNFSGLAAAGGNAFVVLTGATVLDFNRQDGLVAEDAAVISLSGQTSTLEASGNEFGITGDTYAQHFLTSRGGVVAENNRCCAVGLDSGGYASITKLTATNNAEAGAFVTAHAIFLGAATITGSRMGLFAGEASAELMSASSLRGNVVGLYADNASVTIDSGTTITGNSDRDVRLFFGARLTAFGNSTLGSVACDGSDLVRGISCTAAASATRPISALSAQPATAPPPNPFASRMRIATARR